MIVAVGMHRFMKLVQEAVAVASEEIDPADSALLQSFVRIKRLA